MPNCPECGVIARYVYCSQCGALVRSYEAVKAETDLEADENDEE